MFRIKPTNNQKEKTSRSLLSQTSENTSSDSLGPEDLAPNPASLGSEPTNSFRVGGQEASIERASNSPSPAKTPRTKATAVGCSWGGRRRSGFESRRSLGRSARQGRGAQSRSWMAMIARVVFRSLGVRRNLRVVFRSSCAGHELRRQDCAARMHVLQHAKLGLAPPTGNKMRVGLTMST
jgi:hypothetical protein